MTDRRCLFCGGSMEGRRTRNSYCGQACLDSARAKSKAETKASRTRICVQCDTAFVVKKSQIDAGQGKYCSFKCAGHRLTTPENLKYAAERRRESVAENGTAHKTGADHPGWKGGRAAMVERRREKAAKYTKAYRAKNPERVREFSRRRVARKMGRLPRGTVARIGGLQKWRCAVCGVSIKGNYHVDHIMPLAKGGKHVAPNIQLLCPPCNVRKSAKHPVEFMQSRGFLL